MKKFVVAVLILLTCNAVLFSADLETSKAADNVKDMFLMATRKGIVIVDSAGGSRLLKEGTFRYIDFHDGLVYVPAQDTKSMNVWDLEGTDIRTIVFPPEVDWLSDFRILPDGRIAIMDNNKDRVQFLSPEGQLIDTILFSEKEDRWRQNLDSVVIGNELVVIKNSGSSVYLIDIEDYSITTFPDDYMEPPTLSAGELAYETRASQRWNRRKILFKAIIAFMRNKSFVVANESSNEPTAPKVLKENMFYSSWKGAAFEMKDGKRPEQLIELPEGNITDFLADGENIYMCLNFAGKVYRYNLKSGRAEVFAEGFDYPCGMEAISGSGLSATRKVSERKVSKQSSQREKTVQKYIRSSSGGHEIVSSFEEAVEEGDDLAKMWLARSYLMGRCGLSANRSRAQRMAKSALPEVIRLAKEGNDEAQFLLASAFVEGLGVAKNAANAIPWYEKSAAKGFPLAMEHLGWLTMNGDGVKQDIEASRELFKKASLAGSAQAAINLKGILPGLNKHKIKFEDLDSVPYIRNMWKMPTREYMAQLRKDGTISAKPSTSGRGSSGQLSYTYLPDGITLCVRHGLVKGLELYNEGERKFNKFKGELPGIIGWDDTPKSIRDRLGEPDQSIDHMGGHYQLVYYVENIAMHLVFYSDKSNICQIVIKKRWP